MARKAVLEILNETVGRYISDLDVEKLSVSLWKGRIEFPGSVRLNADALNRDYLYHMPSGGSTDDESSNVVEDFELNVNCDKCSFDYSRPKKNVVNESVDGDNDGGDSSNENDAEDDDSSDKEGYENRNPFSQFDPKSFGKHGKTPGSRTLLRRFRIERGVIHKIRIDVPWAALASRPVVVRVSGVNISVAPVERSRKQHFPSPSVPSSPSIPMDSSYHHSYGSPHGQYVHHHHHPHPYISSRGDDWHLNAAALNSSRHGASTIAGGSSRASRTGKMSRGSFNDVDLNAGESKKKKGSAVSTNAPMLQRLYKMLPRQITHEMLKARQKKEAGRIAERRRFLIEQWDKKRRMGHFLAGAMVMNRNDNEDERSLTRHGSGSSSSKKSSRSGIMKDSGDSRVSWTPHLDDTIDNIDVYDRQNSANNLTRSHSHVSIVDNELENDVSDLNGSRHGLHTQRKPISSKRKSSFYDRLKIRIMENLQLDISNVHIQFSCEEEISGSTFSSNNMKDSPPIALRKFLAGIIIDSLSFDTTDEHGRRTFSDRLPSADENFLFKALRISGLGVYIDDRNDNNSNDGMSSVVGSLIDDSVSLDSTQSSLTGTLSNLLRRDFIIQPLSFDAAYRQSDNSSSYNEYPKHLLYSQLPHLSVTMSRNHLELINGMLSAIFPSAEDRGPSPIFPEYRPASSISAVTVHLWWKYAFRCVKRLRFQGRSLWWTDFITAFRQRRRYLQLYKRHRYAPIHPTWCSPPLTSEEVEELQGIESDRTLSVEGIVLWRSMVDRQVEKEEQEQQQQEEERQRQFQVQERQRLQQKSRKKDRQKLQRSSISKSSNKKFLSMFTESIPKESKGFLAGPSVLKVHDNTRGNHNITNSENVYQTFRLTTEEIEELEEQLDFVGDRFGMPRGSKLFEVEFSFGAMVLDLMSVRNSQPIAKLRLGTVETLCSVTSGNEKNSFRMSVLSIQLEDTMTIQPIFPTIVRSVHTAVGSHFGGDHHDDNDVDSITGEPAVSDGDTRDEIDPRAFTLLVETCEDGSRRLDMRMVALEIVASSNFLVDLIDFFDIDGGNVDGSDHLTLHRVLMDVILGWVNHISHVLDVGYNRREEMNEWRKKKQLPPPPRRWHVRCELDGPTIALPEFFSHDQDAEVFVLDCGNYLLESRRELSVGEDGKNEGERCLVGNEVDTRYWDLRVENFKCFLGKTSSSAMSLTSPSNGNGWDHRDNSTIDGQSFVVSTPLLEPVFATIKIGVTYASTSSDDDEAEHSCCECDVSPLRWNISLRSMMKTVKILSSWSSMRDDGFFFLAMYPVDTLFRMLRGRGVGVVDQGSVADDLPIYCRIEEILKESDGRNNVSGFLHSPGTFLSLLLGPCKGGDIRKGHTDYKVRDQPINADWTFRLEEISATIQIGNSGDNSSFVSATTSVIRSEVQYFSDSSFNSELTVDSFSILDGTTGVNEGQKIVHTDSRDHSRDANVAMPLVPFFKSNMSVQEASAKGTGQKAFLKASRPESISGYEQRRILLKSNQQNNVPNPVTRLTRKALSFDVEISQFHVNWNPTFIKVCRRVLSKAQSAAHESPSSGIGPDIGLNMSMGIGIGEGSMNVSASVGEANVMTTDGIAGLLHRDNAIIDEEAYEEEGNRHNGNNMEDKIDDMFSSVGETAASGRTFVQEYSLGRCLALALFPSIYGLAVHFSDPSSEYDTSIFFTVGLMEIHLLRPMSSSSSSRRLVLKENDYEGKVGRKRQQRTVLFTFIWENSYVGFRQRDENSVNANLEVGSFCLGLPGHSRHTYLFKGSPVFNDDDEKDELKGNKILVVECKRMALSQDQPQSVNVTTDGVDDGNERREDHNDDDEDTEDFLYRNVVDARVGSVESLFIKKEFDNLYRYVRDGGIYPFLVSGVSNTWHWIRNLVQPATDELEVCCHLSRMTMTGVKGKSHLLAVDCDRGGDLKFRMDPVAGVREGSFSCHQLGLRDLSLESTSTSKMEILRTPIDVFVEGSLPLYSPDIDVDIEKIAYRSVKVSAQVTKVDAVISDTQLERILRFIAAPGRHDEARGGSFREKVGCNDFNDGEDEDESSLELDRTTSLKSVEVEFDQFLASDRNRVSGLPPYQDRFPVVAAATNTIGPIHAGSFRLTFGLRFDSISLVLGNHGKEKDCTFTDTLKILLDDVEFLRILSSPSGANVDDHDIQNKLRIRRIQVDDLQRQKIIIGPIDEDCATERKEMTRLPENALYVGLSGTNIDSIDVNIIVGALQFALYPQMDIWGIFSMSMVNDMRSRWAQHSWIFGDLAGIPLTEPRNTRTIGFLSENGDDYDDAARSEEDYGSFSNGNEGVIPMKNCNVTLELPLYQFLYFTTRPTDDNDDDELLLCFEGSVDASSCVGIPQNREISSPLLKSLQIQCREMEVSIADEENHRNTILDCEDISIVVYRSNANNNGTTELDVKFVALSYIHLALSTHNFLLSRLILCDLVKRVRGSFLVTDNCRGNQQTRATSITKGSMNIPRASVVLMDGNARELAPLLRVDIDNFVLGGEGCQEEQTFDINIFGSYWIQLYNSSTALWRSCLDKPWDMSIDWKRHRINDRFPSSSPTNRVTVGNYTTHVVVDSGPLQMILSDDMFKSVSKIARQRCSLTSLLPPQEEEADVVVKEGSDSILLPYGIQNQTLSDILFRSGDSENMLSCKALETKFFNFTGQGEENKKRENRKKNRHLCFQGSDSDRSGKKTVTISFVNGRAMDSAMTEDVVLHQFDNLNECEAHEIGCNFLVFTELVKWKDRTILRLRMQATVYNCTRVPFGIISSCGDDDLEMELTNDSKGLRDDVYAWVSLSNVTFEESTTSTSGGGSRVLLQFYTTTPAGPKSVDCSDVRAIWGEIVLPSASKLAMIGNSKDPYFTIMMTSGVFHAEALIRVVMVDSRTELGYRHRYPLVDVFVKPRMTLHNGLPVTVMIRSRSTKTFGRLNYTKNQEESIDGVDAISELRIHKVDPGDNIQILDPNPVIHVTIDIMTESLSETEKFESLPSTGDEGSSRWFDLFLEGDFSSSKSLDMPTSFGTVRLVEVDNEIMASQEPTTRHVAIYAPLCAVDHIGTCRFPSVASDSGETEGNFLGTHMYNFNVDKSNSSSTCRICILKNMDTFKMTIAPASLDEGSTCNNKALTSSIFISVKEVNLCMGGICSTPLLWNNDKSSQSGYFAYRTKTSMSPVESFVHIIPEFIFLNQCGHDVQINNKRIDNGSSCNDIRLEMQKSSISAFVLNNDANQGWVTDPVSVRTMGSKLVVIRCNRDNERSGDAVGKLSLHVSSGGCDARLKVIIGPLDLFVDAPPQFVIQKEAKTTDDHFIFENDFLRFHFGSKSVQFLLVTRSERGCGRGSCTRKVALLDCSGVSISQRRIFVLEKNYETVSAVSGMEDGDAINSVIKTANNRIKEIFVERSKYSLTIKGVEIRDGEESSSVIVPSSILSGSNKRDPKQGPFLDVSVYMHSYQKRQREGDSDLDDVVVLDMVDLNLCSRTVSIDVTSEFLRELFHIFDSFEESGLLAHCHKTKKRSYDLLAMTTAFEFRVVRVSPFLLHFWNLTRGKLDAILTLVQEKEEPSTHSEKRQPTTKAFIVGILPLNEVLLEMSEFCVQNFRARVPDMLEIARILYGSKLKYCMEVMARKERENDAIAVVPELNYIVQDLDRLVDVIPGLSDGTLLKAMDSFAFNELQSVFSVVDKDPGRAVIKESDRGTIMYAGGSDGDSVSSIQVRGKGSGGISLRSIFAESSASTRDFFASKFSFLEGD